MGLTSKTQNFSAKFELFHPTSAPILRILVIHDLITIERTTEGNLLTDSPWLTVRGKQNNWFQELQLSSRKVVFSDYEAS